MKKSRLSSQRDADSIPDGAEDQTRSTMPPSAPYSALRESTERLQLAQKAAQLGLHEYDVQSGTVDWDERTRELWGIGVDEQITYDIWRDSLHPDDLDGAEHAVKRALDPAGDGKYEAEYRIKNRATGEVRWILALGQTTFVDGKPVRLLGTTQDISERKSAEERIRRNHETFFNLVQNSPFGVYVVDSEFRLRQISRGAQKVFENVKPLIGRDFADVLRTIWKEPFASEAIGRFRHTLETGEPYVSVDTTERRHDIPVVESYDWRIERITLPDGHFGVVCYFYDLSALKRAEAELRFRIDQFETLLNRAPNGVYLVDADFRLAQANPVARPVFGDIPDLIGRDLGEILRAMWLEEDAEEIIHIFRHTLLTGQSFHYPEFARRRADRDETEYYDWRIDRITLPDGRHGVVCYFQDISGQVQARLRIARSEAKYRSLFESIDEGFCILQMIFDDENRPIDYLYIETNPAFEKQTGMKNAIGKTVREILPAIEPSWIEIYGNVALTGKPTRFVDHAESMGRWFDVYAFRIGDPEKRHVALLFNDITDRKRAVQQLEDLNRTLEQRVEERTREVRDLASRLTMAEQMERRRISQILHDDLQQILVGIQLKLSTTRAEVEKGKTDTVIEGLTETDGWIRRCVDMTRQLTVELSPPILTGEGLTDALGWLRGQMQEMHGLDIEIHSEHPYVIDDDDLRVMLFHVLRELLFNVAKHAETDHAVVKLSSDPSGDLIMRVIDRGRGLGARAYDAGATGVGGFGLFSIRERVGLFGGRMEIESAPGDGTTVTICIPIEMSAES